MFKGTIKRDLVCAAFEIGENPDESMTVIELTNIIKDSEICKNDLESVRNIISNIVEERKAEDEKQKFALESAKFAQESALELEKIKCEKIKLELELVRARGEQKNSETETEKSESLDSLVKSVRTLTVKLPSKPEGWGFFFSSLERAFTTKSVPEKLKSEILLNLLGEKATNVITYIRENELCDYDKVKAIVQKQFEPTAQACLENFRNSTRQSSESFVQFSSRLTHSLDYYLTLRKVSDFESLKQLIISDKMVQTLDRDTSSHISMKSGSSWFKPLELGKEIDLYNTSRGKHVTENPSYSAKNLPSKNTSKVFLSEVKHSKCVACANFHPLYRCDVYLNMPVKDRIDLVRKNNICFNCISSTMHKSNNCRSKYVCRICSLNHHISLHYPRQNLSSETEKKKENIQNAKQKTPIEKVGQTKLSPHAPAFESIGRQGDSGSFAATSCVNNDMKSVLLSTAVCYMRDNTGKFQPVRMLLDCGSMENFVSLECADRLKLKKQKTNVLVSGLDETSLNINSRINVDISNKDKSFEKNLDFLVIPRISDMMPAHPVKFKPSDLNNVIFADEHFNSPGKVDVLLGAEVYYELLKPGQIFPSNSSLVLQNTVFGFVVSGTTFTKVNSVHCGLVKSNQNLSEIMEKFWNIEDVENKILKPKETLISDEDFVKTHTRDAGGQYVVKMPLKESPNCLGKSRDIALKKLDCLWKRFNRDPEYLKLYKDFLQEYENLGHMREIVTSEEEKGTYYIPHFGIYNPEKSSTKLRVVFNASSPSNNGVSLNALQYNGGVIQDELYTLMLRFRKYLFVFIADIQKMFRMIKIHPDQRKLQRIIWKNGPSEEIKTYELTTVTYGTVSAPYLAQRTLQQLASDERENFPLAAQVLEEQFYMDDCLCGSESLDAAKEIQKQLIGILNSAGMTLHKWNSNHPDLSVNRENSYKFSVPEETKILGVFWNPTKDCFSFKVKLSAGDSHTKTSVLSTIARIFDPLGLLGPIVCKAKIFMQSLWILKIGWNDPLPEKEAKEWQRFFEKLQCVSKIEIERCILTKGVLHIELHGFCDSSMVAYGAVIYCKTTTKDGGVTVKLITSKSRVAPIKTVTIPRLELCSAVLLSKLMHKVRSSLKLEVDKIYCWSDSMIVLAWIQKEPHLLKTFISNRVATIQELTGRDQWRHVSSENNPADLISRGIDPEKLVRNELWFQGPTFLTDREYPNRDIPASVIHDEFSSEFKHSEQSDSSVLTVTSNYFIHELMNISNSYTKILHVVSYIFRFINNLRNPTKKKLGPLETGEIKNSEIFMVKEVQSREFSEELKCLNNQKGVHDKSKIKCLNPFLGEEGVMRVNGRIGHAKINFDSKFPIILPKGHKLTKLILESYHKRYFHLGPTALLHYVRQKFWPIQGKAMCRKIVHDCIQCFRVKPVGVEQLMGDLPKERVTPDFPFNCSGVDFCGPFLVKYRHQRKGIFHKMYVCIFVCMVTKAIHLEIVTDLSAEAFIACLKRFVARRGLCSKLFSDNATNFTGASKELARLHNLVAKPDAALANYMSTEGINWNFLPPKAPNFGGLWESGVKAFKYHFKRVVANSRLTYEEFLTVITQIEGILNSRPLVPLSPDTEVYDVLTPAHFLIGRPLNTVVEPNLIKVKDNRLTNWKKLTKLIQIFWRKWHVQYLNNLQQRSKWMFEKDNVKINELVLLRDDNLPPQKWALGRIIELYFGNDKRVRVVKVKTQSGVYKRPISKICILPIET